MLKNRIKELREERGYSYRDLASLSGVSKTSIVLYEQGKRNPKREVLESLADIFNVDMDYLIGRSDIRSAYAGQIESIRRKKEALNETKLTEGEEMLLNLFRQIPADRQELVLDMIRVALSKK